MFPGLFYVKVVFSMDDATVFMLKKGQTSISNLLLENYTDLGLNDGEFLLLLMLMKFDQQKEDVDLEALSKMMGKTDAEIGTLLNNLIVKKVVDLRTVIDASGRQRDCYDLSFLYEKLVQIVKNQLRTRSQRQETATKEQVFDSFQKEFGRPLSSIELEEIRRWMEEDGYSPEIILLALKEAVLSQAYNFKYIDRILISWEKQNVHSAMDVQRVKDQREEKKTKRNKKKGNANRPKIPLSHWSGVDKDA